MLKGARGARMREAGVRASARGQRAEPAARRPSQARARGARAAPGLRVSAKRPGAKRDLVECSNLLFPNYKRGCTISIRY